MTEHVLAVIPIRGSDPEFKNPQGPILAGRPLLDYTAEAVRASRKIGRCIVSTDSESVAAAARALGLDAPFIRPADLAAKRVVDVLQHAVEWLETHGGFRAEWVLKLEITHPFRPEGLLDQLIETAVNNDLDSAVLSVEEDAAHWLVDAEGRPRPFLDEDDLPRQSRSRIYKEVSGLGTITRAENIRSGQLYGPNVALIPCRTWHGMIDTHDGEASLYQDRLGYQLAEQLAPIYARELAHTNKGD